MDKAQKIKIIDYTVIGLMGVLCFFYSRYIRFFAELRIELPFLNFPIFIGEIVLSMCVLLIAGKFIINKKIEFTIFSWGLAVFLVYIIAKAFYGYFKWGPLAFRNAALFYYFLYAVTGYCSYRSNFLKNKFVKYILLFFIIGIVFFKLAHKAYYFSYFMLVLVFFMMIEDKTLRWLSIILFMIFCYKGILISVIGGRDILVSSVCGYVFILAIGLYNVIKGRNVKYKRGIVVFVAVISLIFTFIIKVGIIDRISIISLIKLKKLLTEYGEFSEEIERRGVNFKFSNPSVKIYEKNSEQILDSGCQPKRETVIKPTVSSIVKIEDKLGRESKAITTVKKIAQDYFRNNDEKEIGKRIFEDYSPGSVVDNKSKPIVTEDKEGKEIFVKSVNLAVADKKRESKPINFDEKVVRNKLRDYGKEKIFGNISESIFQLKEEFEDKSELENKKPIGSEVKFGNQAETFMTHGNQPVEEAENSAGDEFDFQPVSQQEIGRSLEHYQQSILYRLFMWRDMFVELFQGRRILGLDFGKPFRSKSIEILNWDGSWKARVAWLEPHNSYIHIIYRAGVVGIVFIVVVVAIFVKMVRTFIKNNNIKGIILTAVLLYWLIIANFGVILELPYFAIPFWCLFGMVYRYSKNGNT